MKLDDWLYTGDRMFVFDTSILVNSVNGNVKKILKMLLLYVKL